MSDANENAQMIHALMRGLVDRVNGPENAARLIDTRMGWPLDADSQSKRKGTISRRYNGSLRWPLDEIMALEDAVGDDLVRAWMRSSQPRRAEGSSLMPLAGAMTKEFGEAVAAIFALVNGTGDRSNTLKELTEAVISAQRVVAHLEDDEDGMAAPNFKGAR